MSIGRGQVQEELTTEIAAGTAFALLVSLAVASADPREELTDEVAAALDGVGDNVGEVWLNLFGVALDAGPPYDADRFRDTLASLDPVELRRHVLGRHAWSWCTLAGVEDIDAAAAGDAAAAARLLEHPRYYGGNADASLRVLLSLDPDETRLRLVRAVDAASTLVPSDTGRQLEDAVSEAAERLAASPALVAIERLATGYRYVPEPEAERVVLIPHLDARLSLVLAQHRSARLIVYRARQDRSGEERLLAIGRALADPKRLEILRLVGRGVGRASDLVDETGLSRSTVHHHLVQLRDVGLVALEGNAKAYSYVPRPAASAEIAQLIDGLIETEEER